MTTLQDTPTIDRLLRERRGGAFKTTAADEIGVSRQIYDTWETGHHVPGDEWAQKLADYLTRPLGEIVWILYCSRINRVNPRYVKDPLGLLAHSIPLAAA